MSKSRATTKVPPPVVSRRGICLILSSPSGAGKTTLAKRLLEARFGLSLSVSVTTRPQRPNETPGLDYTFLPLADFMALQRRGGLLEWAEVFGNFYGTPREPVETALADGSDMLFDIDWQGARTVSRLLPHDTVRVFILPPSREELVRRIYGRATDAEEIIQARLAAADFEMSHWRSYDYLIVNRDLDESLLALKAILHAERLKRRRQIGLDAFVHGLMEPRQKTRSRARRGKMQGQRNEVSGA